MLSNMIFEPKFQIGNRSKLLKISYYHTLKNCGGASLTYWMKKVKDILDIQHAPVKKVLL